MNHRPFAAARRHARVHWASVSVVALLLLTGCENSVDIPEIVRMPELAGEVADREDLANGPIRLVLSDGAQVDLDRMSALNLRPGTDPNEGDLLLYGTEPGGPWFWSGPLRDDPVTGRQCAFMEGRAVEEGDSIAFEIGLRLPKAPDFDPAEVRDGEFTDPIREFCIDEHGEVTRYGV